MRDRVDVLGGDPARLNVFSGALLDADLDSELQAVTEEAARALATPMALVSLMLHRTQFFRARYGLPPDLAAACATDRDVSFCQFVVRDNAPFEVNDTHFDERVPQDLVKRYGLRAYLGVPVTAGGKVVGSLCVLDLTPRTFSAHDRLQLTTLAAQASRRLGELAGEPRGNLRSLLERATSPAFMEIRNLMQTLHLGIQVAQVAATEMAVLRRAMKLGGEGRRAQEALEQTQRAFDDLDQSLATTEQVAAKVLDQLLAVEATTARLQSPAALPEIAQAAWNLAHHVTKLVGFTAPQSVPDVLVQVPKGVGVSVLAALLSTTAKLSKAGTASARLACSFEMKPDRVRVRVTDPTIDAAGAAAAAQELALLVGHDESATIGADGAALYVEFPLAIGEATTANHSR